MIDIETKRILNRFADIADRYVVIQEKHYKLISEPGFIASEPKSSCCSVHAGSSEECKEECNHEWYGGEAYGDSAERKCKKCGAFYL